MPRETKAQRLARQEQERVAREAQEQAEYFPRVMTLLMRAGGLGWDINIPDVKTFELVDRDNDERYAIFVEYDARETWMLDEAESAVERAKRERDEAIRKELARRTALNKLTEAERELLGL
jgi:CHASE3 domain sensor protein